MERLTRKNIIDEIRRVRHENYDLFWKLATIDEILFNCLNSRYLNYTKLQLLGMLDYLKGIAAIYKYQK